jgi:FRG domain
MMNRPRRKYEVDNVDEAISLAKRFRDAGQFDLFRGQLQNWPMEPTLRRLSASMRDAARDKFKRLAYWALDRPPLKSMAEDVVTLSAIAQHYGVPTTYLDFTADPGVAGFFATDVDDSRSFKATSPSCIICLNSRVFEDIIPNGNFDLLPRVIRIDVQNLWRLQAQSGSFVHVPERGRQLEPLAPCTKILFPFKGRLTKPGKDEIYPVRKSQLEILLNKTSSQS